MAGSSAARCFFSSLVFGFGWSTFWDSMRTVPTATRKLRIQDAQVRTVRQSAGDFRCCRSAPMPEISDEMMTPLKRYFRRVPMMRGYWPSTDRRLVVRCASAPRAGLLQVGCRFRP